MQRNVLAFLYDTTRRQGYQPSYAEIAERFGWSSLNSVTGFLNILAHKGWIKVVPREVRAIRFLYTPAGRPFRGFSEQIAPDPVESKRRHAPPYPKAPLTPRQFELLRCLHEWTRRQGFQPSYREMADALGIKSLNGISHLLRALERNGWIEVPPSHWRAIRFLYTPSGEPFRGFAERAAEG